MPPSRADYNCIQFWSDSRHSGLVRPGNVATSFCDVQTRRSWARHEICSKAPRTPGEQWVEWNTRTLRKARVLLHQLEIDRWSTFILSGLHGHAYRGDQVARAMLKWRDLQWWRIEQSIPPSWGGQRHAGRYNPHLDVERQIAAAAGEQWQSITADRIAWAALETKFVEMHDVPWASGGQEAIANLAPNKSTDGRPAPKRRQRSRKIRTK